ncbi:MAG: hypothetical protein CL816_07370 [Coxiellaceae bacterium]|nr:hypothetical protein [Coxiellaceae bacterium]
MPRQAIHSRWILYLSITSIIACHTSISLSQSTSRSYSDNSIKIIEDESKTNNSFTKVIGNLVKSGEIFEKCRIKLVPYTDKASCQRFSNTCNKRYRLVTIAPSMTISKYNRRRSTIIIDKTAKKSYFLYINADNTLKLEPTENYITRPKRTRVMCTIKASPQNADPAYFQSIEDQGKNSNIRQKRFLRLRPSLFKSKYNNKRATLLIDISARNVYLFWLDKEDNLKLKHITEQDIENFINNKNYDFIDRTTDASDISDEGVENIKSTIKNQIDQLQNKF